MCFAYNIKQIQSIVNLTSTNHKNIIHFLSLHRSIWIKGNTPPELETSWLGGWKTASMVERYVRLAPDYLANAATRLDSMFNGYDIVTVDQNEKRLASVQAA